jgi:cytochrome c553
MKLFRLKIAILAIACSALPSLAGNIVTVGVRDCGWCHGTSGQGFGNAPRLAGQQYQYIENQLLNFFEHARDNPLSRQYMWGAASGLNGEIAHALAVYFSLIPPQSADDGHRDLIAIGRLIYEEGSPETNLVSCAACHGPNGEGVREIPRLAGLSYDYLKRRLEEWGEGYHVTAEPPMPRIAGKLYPEEIAAIASYLSFAQ